MHVLCITVPVFLLIDSKRTCFFVITCSKTFDSRTDRGDNEEIIRVGNR